MECKDKHTCEQLKLHHHHHSAIRMIAGESSVFPPCSAVAPLIQNGRHATVVLRLSHLLVRCYYYYCTTRMHVEESSLNPLIRLRCNLRAASGERSSCNCKLFARIRSFARRSSHTQASALNIYCVYFQCRASKLNSKLAYIFMAHDSNDSTQHHH